MQIVSFSYRQGQQRPKTEAGKPKVARGHKAWWEFRERSRERPTKVIKPKP